MKQKKFNGVKSHECHFWYKLRLKLLLFVKVHYHRRKPWNCFFRPFLWKFSSLGMIRAERSIYLSKSNVDGRSERELLLNEILALLRSSVP